ncbi:MAG: restriction endonuclease subunit S, partial [Chloroflexi bacterium]|nr:restriction endonuclease subunit S [Chloroflexota bacterium]
MWTKLEDIAEIIRGVSYKKNVSQSFASPGYIPVLRATNIQERKLILHDSLVFVPASIAKEEQYLRPGDSVICISSGSKHLVGKSAMLRSKWKGAFGAFLAVVRPASHVDAQFVGYFLNSPQYQDAVRRLSSGININNLRIRDLAKIRLPLPPLPEQRRIVAKIEALFSRLDAAEEGLRRVQRNLKRYRAAVLKAA